MSMPLPPGKRLAVPPMHKDVARADRVKVCELVLRRLFGEAWDLAVDLEIDRRKRALKAADQARHDEIVRQLDEARARRGGRRNGPVEVGLEGVEPPAESDVAA